MSKFQKFLIIFAITILLCTGFSITINNFHFEFKGIVKIILEKVWFI